MNIQVRGLALIVGTITLFGGTLYGGRSLAADDPASDVTVTKDLTIVIALQGLPCGPVVSATERGENDYDVSCKDGNRYRVFVNAEGRVTVEKKP